jgi:hypothetical protein
MCAEIRKMGSRFWELYSKEAIFLTILLGGGALTFIMWYEVSAPVGIATAWIWGSVICGEFSESDLPPFTWIESYAYKWTLIALGPLTCLGILMGCAVCIGGAPFFLYHDGKKKSQKQRKEVEEGRKGIKIYPPNLRNWLIGGAIYYACLAGALVAILLVLTSN